MSDPLQSHQKALAIRERILPQNHLDIAISNNNIGLIYFEKKNFSKALPLCEKSLDIMKKALPPHHPVLGNAYDTIGILYYLTGKYSEAILYLQSAINILQYSMPPIDFGLQLTQKYINAAKNKL
jgi:tetratricopeptide (TPR) repeat protein